VLAAVLALPLALLWPLYVASISSQIGGMLTAVVPFVARVRRHRRWLLLYGMGVLGVMGAVSFAGMDPIGNAEYPFGKLSVTAHADWTPFSNQLLPDFAADGCYHIGWGDVWFKNKMPFNCWFGHVEHRMADPEHKSFPVSLTLQPHHIAIQSNQLTSDNWHATILVAVACNFPSLGLGYRLKGSLEFEQKMEYRFSHGHPDLVAHIDDNPKPFSFVRHSFTSRKAANGGVNVCMR
jgi:hypothetical protein